MDMTFTETFVYSPQKKFNLSEWICTVVDKRTGLRAQSVEKKSSKKKAKALAVVKLLKLLQQTDSIAEASFKSFTKRALFVAPWVDTASMAFASRLLVERRDQKRTTLTKPRAAMPEYRGPDRYCLNCGYGGGYKSAKLLRCRGCKKAWFCDKYCLAQKWPAHKADCKYVPPPPRKLTKIIDRFRSEPTSPASSTQPRTCTSGEALQVLARKWRRVATGWGLEVAAPAQCGECGAVWVGRVDPSDGCFYCLACWVDFNAQQARTPPRPT